MFWEKVLQRQHQYHPTSSFWLSLRIQIHPSLTGWAETERPSSAAPIGQHVTRAESDFWPVTARRAVSFRWRSAWRVERWTCRRCGSLEVRRERVNCCQGRDYHKNKDKQCQRFKSTWTSSFRAAGPVQPARCAPSIGKGSNAVLQEEVPELGISWYS